MYVDVNSEISRDALSQIYPQVDTEYKYVDT